MNKEIVEASINSEIEEVWPSVIEAIQFTKRTSLAVTFFGHLNATLGELALQDWFKQMSLDEQTYATMYFTKTFTDKALSVFYPAVPLEAPEKANG